MNKRNLVVIVVAAASMIACESDKQHNQRVFKKLREESYQEALAELPKLEARLFANQQEKENGVERGGDIYLQHCARCHGVYAQGGDTAFDLKNKETGETAHFEPPELKPQRFDLDSDILRQLRDYAQQIKNGGRYMPPIGEFPRDKSGNPSLDAVREMMDYIKSAPRLSSYRSYLKEGKPK